MELAPAAPVLGSSRAMRAETTALRSQPCRHCGENEVAWQARTQNQMTEAPGPALEPRIRRRADTRQELADGRGAGKRDVRVRNPLGNARYMTDELREAGC